MAGNVGAVTQSINDAAKRAAQVRKAAQDAAETPPPAPQPAGR